MSYTYINNNDIVNYVHNNRVAVVVNDISSNNIDEYINNCIITLNNEGFNTNSLTQPRVYKRDGRTNLVLLVKSSANMASLNMLALNNWMRKMGNVVYLKDYTQSLYKRNVQEVNSDIKKIDITFRDINTGRKVSSSIQLKKSNNDIVAGCMEISKHGVFNEDLRQFNNNVPRIIEYFCGIAFRQFRLNPESATVTVGKTIYKYIIQPTANSIKLTLVK